LKNPLVKVEASSNLFPSSRTPPFWIRPESPPDPIFVASPLLSKNPRLEAADFSGDQGFSSPTRVFKGLVLYSTSTSASGSFVLRYPRSDAGRKFWNFSAYETGRICFFWPRADYSTRPLNAESARGFSLFSLPRSDRPSIIIRSSRSKLSSNQTSPPPQLQDPSTDCWSSRLFVVAPPGFVLLSRPVTGVCNAITCQTCPNPSEIDLMRQILAS